MKSVTSNNSDLSDSYSVTSKKRADESIIIWEDLVKLTRFKFPQLSYEEIVKLYSELNLDEDSQVSISSLKQRIELKLVSGSEFKEFHTQLRSLLESPIDKGMRIINQIRTKLKEDMKEELRWLENSIFDNNFTLLNQGFVDLCKELDLSVTKNDNFVDEFVKVKKIESTKEIELLRKELTTNSTKADELTPVGYRSKKSSFSCFAEKYNSTILESASSAEFSVFEYTGLETNVLVNAFSELIKTKFGDLVDCVKATDFIYKIAEGYEENFNPYHNSIHATDVMLSIYQYGCKFKLDRYFFKQEQLALFFAAAIHDYKHMGFNNNYYIRLEKDIALRYNNQSPLENFHLYEAFKLLRSSSNMNIFSKLPESSYLHIKEIVIKAVLSTDVREHNDVIERAKRSFGVEREELLQQKLEQLSVENKDNLKTRQTQMQDLANLLIHCADVSNPTKKFKVYNKWVDLVFKEFRNQGKKEINLGLTPSFLCEPNPDIPRSQVGFMNGFVKPTFVLLTKILPELGYLVKEIEKNVEEYNKIISK